MILELIIFLITTVIIYLWFNLKTIDKYYQKKNVRYLPEWPVFGNTLKSTTQKEHFFYDIDRIYKTFPNERYIGYLDNMKPHILIRDPELIKQITVKDFDYFTDHKDFFTEHVEPLFATSLFMMRGEKWRDMRTILSPAFTGSKMKYMMQFMVDISKNFLEYLKEHKGENIHVDDIVHRFTNDVIASASFGLEVNSLKDRDNQFFRIGQSVLNFDLRQLVIMFLDELFPSLIKLLGIKLYPESTYKFFKDIIQTTMEYRKTNNVHRPDMIQLLMETSKEWTADELCAQAFIFFGAGFETTSTALVMTIHELALNPDIQEKLYQEIKEFKETNTDITCDNINSMKYLDAVINETLRKWSPAIVADRKCVKTYQLPPSREGGEPCILQPGDLVYNSVNSLHLDPQYWPDPLKYDPDRWSDENKHNIVPFTYQPFGLGPRICIGKRFAILEVKVFIYYLLLNFKILKSEKTSDPIELIRFGMFIKAAGGTWAKFEERK